MIPGEVIRKPDPCIYDQFLLMQLGQPVTWDNPDVRILKNGVEQYTYDLTAGTEYDIEITVHNSSREKPATATTVDIQWIEFGAGGQIAHPISVESVNVPVWPGTALAVTKWTTPTTPGHYCIQVQLSHPNDGNPANNRGWNNTLVHAASSPAEREIRVFNRYPDRCPPIEEGGGPWLRPHRVLYGWGLLGLVATLMFHHTVLAGVQPVARGVALMAAGYVLAVVAGLFAESAAASLERRRRQQRGTDPRKDRIDCHLVEVTVDSYEFHDTIGKDFDPAAVFANTAPAWPARVTPSNFVFAAGEAYRDVVLHVDAPDDRGLSRPFNVTVWQGGVPSGGATVTITTGGG